MKTFLEKTHGVSLINFIKNGKNSFSPDIKKYSIIKTISGKSNFTLNDLRNFSKLGLAIQVNGNDFIEPNGFLATYKGKMR